MIFSLFLTGAFSLEKGRVSERRRVSLAKKPSTALSQEQDVGTKWKVQRGMAVEPRADLRVLVRGVVVEDGVDRLAGRHRGLDGVEEADELLMAVALPCCGR